MNKNVHMIGWMSSLAGVALAVLAAFSFWPSSAHATMYTYIVTLNESQALNTCDPNPAPAGGGGSGTVSYDSVTNMLSWNVTFSNLSSLPPIAAHFHGPAVPGVGAGIQVTIGDVTSPSVGSAAITEGQEADLLAGLYYINYHTSACSGGEIRGQVANSVGGVTGLGDPAVSPLTASPQADAGNGSSAWLYLAVAAVTLFCAGGALVMGRRLRGSNL